MPESEGSGGEHKHRTPSLALVPPSAYPMRERSPVPCAQPSPRGDAPSPLAFAKSCKGGDVSVLDPALAWDVRLFIYLLAAQAGGDEISCSAEREQAPPCPVCDAGRWSCHRRFAHNPTPPQPSPARDTISSAGLSSSSVCRQGGTHSGTVATRRGSRRGSREGTAGNRGAGLFL